jgi:FkbM family methyltransferase
MSEVNSKNSLSRWQHMANRYRLFRNWYKLTFPFNRLFNKPTILVTRNGSRVWVRSVFSWDPEVIEGVIVRREYRLDEMNLPENAVIYDLGANIGTFSIEAKRVCPAARIVSYEPADGNFAMLTRNAPFAELHQEAIAGHTGTVQFDATAHPHAHHVVQTGGTSVPARSLQDAIGKEKVDLIKMDIEGAEFDAIEKADPALFKQIDRIVMETHALGDWGEKKLRSLGYKTLLFWEQDLGPKSNAIIYGERVHSDLHTS